MANPRKLSFEQLVRSNRGMAITITHLEMDLEDERAERVKLENELGNETQDFGALISQMAELANEATDLQNALAMMRELYLGSFEALEAQKKLNKALIAGLLG